MPLDFHDNTLSTSLLPPSLLFLPVSCSSWAPSVGLALSCLLFLSDLIQPSSANDSQIFISSLGLYLDLQHPHVHGDCMCDLSVPTTLRSPGSSLLHLLFPRGVTSLWALSRINPLHLHFSHLPSWSGCHFFSLGLSVAASSGFNLLPPPSLPSVPRPLLDGSCKATNWRGFHAILWLGLMLSLAVLWTRGQGTKIS